MAEGVDNQAESVRLESDDFHEYPCLPCAKDNRNVAAIKYCVDCDENICDKCVSAHNKYAGLKDHQVSDRIKTTPGQGGPGLPSQRCDTHAGKIIDVYCADHDFVGCATCIAIGHRSCEEVTFIPDIASTFSTSKDLQDLKLEIQELERRINMLKNEKAKYVENLIQDKENILYEISLLRQKINNRLDQMEKSMLEEVDTFFKETNEAISSVVREISCVVDTTKEVHAALSNIKDKNDSALFVEVKKSKEVLRSNSSLLKLLEDSHFSVKSGFYISRAIENILSSTSSLGSILKTPTFKTAPVCMEFNARLESDQLKCEFRNCCLTKSGEIVLTDQSNRKVKIFTINFSIKDFIATSAIPIGVCEIDNSRLAISLYDKACVQFLSRNPSIKI